VFLDRIVETSSKSLIGRYEEQIVALERNKLLLEEKQALKSQPDRSFDELFELALKFLGSPLKLWKFGGFSWKQLVLRLAFADNLVYCAKNRISNP
jgi:site-specific DNA recombinase